MLAGWLAGMVAGEIMLTCCIQIELRIASGEEIKFDGIEFEYRCIEINIEDILIVLLQYLLVQSGGYIKNPVSVEPAKFEMNFCTQLKYSAFFGSVNHGEPAAQQESSTYLPFGGVASLKPLKTVNLALINELMACLFCDLCCAQPVEWSVFWAVFFARNLGQRQRVRD